MSGFISDFDDSKQTQKSKSPQPGDTPSDSKFRRRYLRAFVTFIEVVIEADVCGTECVFGGLFH
jgi:hypothetical protein